MHFCMEKNHKPFIRLERVLRGDFEGGGKSKEFPHLVKIFRFPIFRQVWLLPKPRKQSLPLCCWFVHHLGSVTCPSSFFKPFSGWIQGGSFFPMNYGDLNFNYPWKRLPWRVEKEAECKTSEKSIPRKVYLLLWLAGPLFRLSGVRSPNHSFAPLALFLMICIWSTYIEVNDSKKKTFANNF